MAFRVLKNLKLALTAPFCVGYTHIHRSALEFNMTEKYITLEKPYKFKSKFYSKRSNKSTYIKVPCI